MYALPTPPRDDGMMGRFRLMARDVYRRVRACVCTYARTRMAQSACVGVGVGSTRGWVGEWVVGSLPERVCVGGGGVREPTPLATPRGAAGSG